MRIVLCLLLAIVVFTESPPVFPPQYELAFNEKASLGPISGNTTGKIYLDYTHNTQFISRANGHHDRYCGSVFKFVDTPCNHYVVDSNIVFMLRQEILGLPCQKVLLFLL